MVSRYACLGHVGRVYDSQQQFPLSKDLASKVTFFLLVYFTLSHVTLLSHGPHVQSHDGSPDLSHDKGT